MAKFDPPNSRHGEVNSNNFALVIEEPATSVDCWRKIASLRVEESRWAVVFLGCVRRFQLRARLGPPWHHRDLLPHRPTVQISRSGFLKQDSPGTSRDVEFEVTAKDTD